MKPNYFFVSTAFLLLLFGSNSYAQFFSPPNKSWVSGTGPYSIISADFNGDGKKDLVTSNSGANNVSVYLGVAIGSFAVAVTFAVGTGPYAVVSADFNGDGKADIASCNAGSNNVSILLGNGAGSFGAAVNFATGNGPRSLTVGDFNMDLKMDLATANYAGANASILLGNGLGSFAAPVNFAAGNGPRSILNADFNGDAKPDLAISNETSNNISVLIGSGTGTFGAATNFAVGTNPRSITTADFNGDGKKDLVTANSSNNVSVLLGTGTGSFSAATNVLSGNTPYSVLSADFNTDGKMDIAVANWGAMSIWVMQGTGLGTFLPAKIFKSTIWTVPANPSSICTNDFNNDTKPDIAISNFGYNSISTLNSFIPTVGTCTNPMKIVMLGASGTFGFGASVFDSAFAYRFRQYIIDSVNGYSDIFNISHAGYTTYAMQPTGYPAPGPFPVDTVCNITKALWYKPDACIFNFTTNDVNNLINIDTTKNNLLRATNMLVAKGIPFWVTTTQPRNFTGDPPATIASKKAQLLQMRDTIIKYYPLNYIESYVGFAQGNGDILVQYDCGDNTHFNDAGHRKLFQNVKAAGIPGKVCPLVTLGIDNSSKIENVNIYPNPSNGIFSVETSNEITSLEITDVFGKIIYKSLIEKPQSEIDLSDKAKGIYFVRFLQDKKIISTNKLIIAN